MIEKAEIDEAFPNDHADQIDAYYYLQQLPEFEDRKSVFLDLGAGPGNSHNKLSKIKENFEWIGVDIENSGPVRSRSRSDLNFVTYDGVNIPCEDNSVDMIFSRQVFEHVRYPELLMKDIHRVLRPGGLFVGSVSQLEPFHSHSFFNFTYYGFAVIGTDAGLVLEEFRPGVDGLTLCSRNFFKFILKEKVEVFDSWIRGTSPLNGVIDRLFGGDVRGLNKRKVHMAGHICFQFSKPIS